jgi:hypothetical protein
MAKPTASVMVLTALFLILAHGPASALSATLSTEDSQDELALVWTGDESIRVGVEKDKGPFNAPVRVRVGESKIEFNGFYIRVNGVDAGFQTNSMKCVVKNRRLYAEYVLAHPQLAKPVSLSFVMWMEPQDRGLRLRVTFDGNGAHLDRLGIGDYTGNGLAARRMFFGRIWVLDRPEAFEHEHNYNTCRFWCRRMDNGLTELQATGGPAKGFRYDPARRFDLYTYCESPIDYVLFFSAKDPQDIIAEYRNTITIPAPPTLSQLPGRVGVMTAYPIGERYEDFLEEWTGRGARDFVWLSYFPTPGDRQKVEPYGAIYATYDTYLDAFKEGPRKYEGWSPETAQYRDNGKMVRGYWSSAWLLPDLYVKAATTRVMGVFGHEFRNDQGELDFVPSAATRFSNLAITKAEVNPNGLYLDVHASKTPHHFFDYRHNHHGAWEHMRGEKALFDFARSYLGNAPIWSEGGGEDYAGIMDGGWFMDWRPPQEEGIQCAKWQYYPFVDQIHRERLLNMGIYYPVQGYEVDMVNAAILFGRPQAVSVYSGTPQEDVAGRLMAYYMTKAFHRMLALSRMDRVDFQDDDIDRAIVTYSNGVRVWSNRGPQNWDVEGHTLPPMGWLIKGPDNFLEYHALKDDATIDVVRSPEYDFFSATKHTDFGPLITDGALAVIHKDSKTLTVYEVRKPAGAFTLKLGELPGTQKGQRATHAWVVLTRGRKLELTFPDLRQAAGPNDPSRPGNSVDLRPVEMHSSLAYELQLEPGP